MQVNSIGWPGWVAVQLSAPGLDRSVRSPMHTGGPRRSRVVTVVSLLSGRRLPPRSVREFRRPGAAEVANPLPDSPNARIGPQCDRRLERNTLNDGRTQVPAIESGNRCSSQFVCCSSSWHIRGGSRGDDERIDEALPFGEGFRLQRLPKNSRLAKTFGGPCRSQSSSGAPLRAL